MMKRHNSLSVFLAAVVLLTLAAVPAAADVRDAGEFFSPAAEREADRLMQQIRQRHGKDVAVETVASLPNVPAGARERDDYYAGEVARRGREAGVDGIYILVSRQPTYAYPGVDPDTQKAAFTGGDRSALRDLMVGRFKQKDFDGGLIDGLKLIDERLAANASGKGAAAAAAPGSAAAGGSAADRSGQAADGRAAAPGPAPAPRAERRGMGITGWLCLGVAALVVFAIFRSMAMRRRAAAAGGGYGAPGSGRPGYDPRTGQPMGGPGGYDPRYGPPQGAGGGMMGGGMGRGLLGGLLGGMAGGYLYDKMSGGAGAAGNEAGATPLDPNSTPVENPDPSAGLGGGDFGGGGDLGGGDFGGGDFGGGGE